MNIITIPKNLNKKNLVAVPRKAYEEFLTWQKKVKQIKTYEPTASEKRAIARARKDIKKGNFITLEELIRELDRHHSPKR